MKHGVTVTMLLVAALLSACSNRDTVEDSSVPTAERETASAAPTSPAKREAASAAEIVDALRTKGLPVGEAQAYTAANDPNSLLGRPGQYTSKVNFHDTRLPESETFSTVAGGGVEHFASERKGTSEN